MGKKTKGEGVRDFGVVLSQIDHGGLVIELSEAQQQLTDDLFEHAQHNAKAKGRLTLTIDYEHDNTGKVLVRSKVATKAPQRVTAASVFWTDKAGNLVNKDPRQGELAFRDVNAGTSEAARDAFAESGLGVAREVRS